MENIIRVIIVDISGMYANICDELYMKQDEVEKYRQVIMDYKEQWYAVIVCRY